jgi:cobalt/nickel transport system ATP-binding protein
MITASGLSFFYAPGQPALHRVTFALQPGERVVLLGANGAGKSTLLSLCNGLLQPCHGELRLLDKPFTYTNAGLRHLRRHVATVLQDPSDQLFGATALQDVAMGPAEDGASDSLALHRAGEALHALGIGHLAQRPIHALSVGEKERVALAGVLVGNPSVLLLDEPTAGLDAPGEDALLDSLSARSAQGLTVCIATHDTTLLHRWATRALVLRAGKLAFDGSAPDLLHHWRRHTANCGLREPAACTESLLR